ncbi:amino acid adenylation domain protein [Gloeocapsa sp. PCC 7428]|uniref:non-ribosomal peptide synthetase n=1 Tax=Gloeocapsa sp. PCC 7428 TaxID=1173026 RepID=UPI0002A5FC9D|nr:non-ribosomal peptide synthetase [Gloeocapsa sp. PCC 7428]AFZ30327.1 amino acid adenylation domain protein [Gloeocapsa sp. PCC 7428]
MNKKNIENIYPLSPIQQGMLFHTLSAPESGIYFVQSCYTFTKNIDIPAFKQAWQQIINQHPILRTSFYWKQHKEPFQVVHRYVELPWQEYDWQSLSVVEQQASLEVFLQADRQQGFDISQPPLMRLILIQVAQETYHFIWSSHHLLLDGWSTALVLQQVFQAYESLCQGQVLPLSRSRPYADYIAWLQQQNLDQAEAFWRKVLKGFTAPTQLRIGSLSNSATGSGEESIKLSPVTTAALQTLARQHKLTLNTVLQGAWAILLSRYSGEEDVVFGATSAGRPPALAGSESMVGLFINTLPVRVQVSGNELLIPWLQKLQAQQLETQQYEYSPLVQVQGWSEIRRDLPLFESIFVFENYPVDASLKEWATEMQIHNIRSVESTNYPITLSVGVSTELSLKILYDCSRFDVATIRAILVHLKTLLESIVVNPSRSLFSLPLLTKTEQNQLLEWNTITTEYPQDKCIHQLFEEQVEKTPEAVAVVFEEQYLTYRELNTRANQLAHYLQKLGVESEALVGICVERSLEMVIGILGILKAGGAYIPLDPSYPQQRLAFMLEDSQTEVLLSQQNLVAQLGDYAAKVICLDTDWEKISQESQENLLTDVSSHNLAYVIYTSGSTGTPKGVLIQHSNVVRLLAATQAWFEFNSDDVWTLFHSYAFDFSVWEIWGALLYGGRLVVVPYWVSRTPEEFYKLLSTQGVTVLNQTPSAFYQLIQADAVLLQQYSLNLRFVIFGGEALVLQSLKPWFERHGDRSPQLVNMYGITETTVHVTYRRLTQEDVVQSLGSVIGRPIPDLQVYLLDQNQQLLPIGVVGEMYVGGAGIARGYLNQPELTTQRFIANPFSHKPDARLYKTGDLARYLPSGELEYIGRLDHQVKIRGFRIELGEIEAAINQHPSVSMSVVVVRQDEAANQSLVAYITLYPEQIVTIAELRRFLESKLPNYMVITAIVVLEALPLTPNGKIDRRALPAPNVTQLISESNFVTPATPVEEMLAGVWAEVLGLEKVGVNDNFFDLGGHSLLATRVISQIRQVFEVEIPLRRLFELPTLSALAKEIQTAINADNGLELPPIKRIERSQALPLSFAQQRLWFLSQLEPDSPFYNIPTAVRLEGQLNLAALEQSFNEILRRHEVLRTHFRTVEGQAIAVVSPTTPQLLSVIDLSKLPPPQQETKVRQLALAEAQQPFNLEADTLLRVKLLCLSEQEYVTLLTMHHIVSDGWSIEVLVREVAILYQAFCEGQPSPLPELEIQYVDFTAWQKQWLEGEILESQLAYWLKQLDGAPAVLELATDYPRPAIQSSRGAKYSFCLSLEQSLALKSLSQQQGSTLFMTLLTAFKTLLHRYTKSNDIVIGSPIANRNHSQIEGLIGFFANTLVLRTNLEGNPSFQELLHRVKEVALEAYTHQDTPFELLVEKIQPQRDLSHTPLFQVMFVLQNAQTSEIKLPGLTLSTLESDSGTANFDLTLNMRETAEGLVGTIEYSIDLFKPQTIQRMADHLQILLCGIIANPEQRLSELPLLTADEQHQLLVGWNQTQVEYPQNQCIHQLFEAQVERTPDAVAVVFEDEQLTYHQLNQRANQLAHYLQKLGVGTEVLVGICVERSLEMIVGLLAILKAGGAYLPLDLNYPQERLAFMLQDAQVKILLTQAHLLEILPPHQAKTICIDNWQIIKNESQENINTLVLSINNAYILYTSGSTGQPKAVVIEHQNVIDLIYWAKEIFSYQDISGVLASTSICFDLSVFEIFVPLSWGGKVIVIENLLHLQTSVAAQKVTLINTVPSAIAELLRINGIPACVRTINLAGEALPQKLVQQLYQKTSVQNVFNLYGPSEDTTYSTFSLVNAEDNLITIGRPIANTQIYILDSQLQLSPIGIPGEVYICSNGLARGYLNRPTLTAEKFIPNPFSHKIGARLYKTGDLARYLPDGNIEFLGRIDHQVKIRGFRIELGEIEAVLSQHPAVQASVVTAEEQRIVAYWVAKQPAPAISELRHFLDQNLPQYMIPATFVQLPALPLTPNGKVDRKALPAPDYVRPELETQFIAPRTPIEAKLAQIWAEVLRVEQVGIEDNFFELGGDSILTIQIVAKANQAGLRLTAKQLFQYQNIAELASVCLTTEETTQTEQGIVTGLVPLTPIQQWFFRQNLPELHHYNQAVLLEIQQAIAPDLLRQSIQHLYIHHDALRLRFEQTNSGWEQIIAPPEKEVTLAQFDFSALSAAEQQPAIEAAATKLQASFDLSSGVLIQVALFDLGSHQPSRLLAIVHHLAVDGVSWRILLEDLQTVYEQLSRGKTVKLPAKTTSFKQWSYYLQEYAKSEALAQEQHYWLALSQKETLALPVDYFHGENTEASKDIVSIELNVEETQALLKEVPQAYNTQINDVLLTALGQTFASWTGNQSLLVELEGHGREEIFDNVDLSRTVGWFTSIFPVHINLEAALDPGTALKIVKEELRSIPNRGIGYSVLRYLSHDQQITETLNRISKAEVLFNYLGQFDQTFSQFSAFKFAQESSGLALSQRGQRSHLLEINALITNSKLRVNWAYSKNLHRQTTVKFIAEKFKEVLCELIAHCLSPEAGGYTPSDFPDVMLDENQLEKVLAEMGLD